MSKQEEQVIEEDEALLDAKQVARLFKASPSWVYKAAQRGTIPSIHIGALLRFEPKAMREWLAQQRSGLTVDPHRSVDVLSARERG